MNLRRWAPVAGLAALGGMLWCWRDKPDQLSAGGTIAAVALILFKSAWDEWRGSPKLEIAYRAEEPYARDAGSEIPIAGRNIEWATSRWFRLEVRNCGGSSALRCEARIEEILKDDGTRHKPFEPITLRWATSDEERIEINHGSFNFASLICASVRSGKPKARIACHSMIHGMEYFLPKGRYRLKFVVYSSNSEPVSEWIVMNWDETSIQNLNLSVERRSLGRAAKSLLSWFPESSSNRA